MSEPTPSPYDLSLVRALLRSVLCASDTDPAQALTTARSNAERALKLLESPPSNGLTSVDRTWRPSIWTDAHAAALERLISEYSRREVDLGTALPIDPANYPLLDTVRAARIALLKLRQPVNTPTSALPTARVVKEEVLKGDRVSFEGPDGTRTGIVHEVRKVRGDPTGPVADIELDAKYGGHRLLLSVSNVKKVWRHVEIKAEAPIPTTWDRKRQVPAQGLVTGPLHELRGVNPVGPITEQGGLIPLPYTVTCTACHRPRLFLTKPVEPAVCSECAPPKEGR